MGKNKMKSKKAATKRFKITGSGRVMHKQTGKGHLLSKKSRRRKRRLSAESEIKGRPARTIRDTLLSK